MSNTIAAVTSAPPKKIKWSSNVLVEFVGPLGVISSRPVQPAETIYFDRATFGLPGNLTLSVQIYAPGITDKIKGHSYSDQFDISRQAIKIIGLLLKSDIITNRVCAFTPGSLGGGFVGGWDNNDLLAYWSLGDPGNSNGGHLEVGVYNVTVIAEGGTLISFAIQLV